MALDQTEVGSAVAAPQGPAVAVMQPYFFPYLGYFNLIHSSESFVFYDDVNHITRGWIHRNRILVNGAPHTFTVPLAGSSQNRLIHEIQTHDFASFRKHFLRQLECAYRRAPHFDATRALVSQVLMEDANPGIADLAIRSVRAVCSALELKRNFYRSSHLSDGVNNSGREERLASITRSLGGVRYVNAAGGTDIYEYETFEALGVRLQFVHPHLDPYRQSGTESFIAGLSIIDVLMHNTLQEVRDMLFGYALH